MLKILNITDIDNSNLTDTVKKYLTDYTKSILNQYQVNSLQRCGCIYFLECNQDTQSYKNIGLYQPLKDTPFEYCELISLKCSHGETKLLHGCYIFNNDFSIDIFGNESIFDNETRQTLLDNLNE